MRNVFIDIGAHIGESIEIATSKKYNFDEIYAIEPSTYCQKYLDKYKDKRLRIIQIGFGSETRSTTLFGAGSVGASIFLEKTPYWSLNEEINIIKFSEWYNKNIAETDLVWIKLNAEGSELEIIQELKYIVNQNTIMSFLISFDVEKIPSLKKEKMKLMSILEQDLRIPYSVRKQGFEVEEWLNSFNQIKNKSSLYNFFYTKLRPDLPWSRNIRRIIKPVIPHKIWLITAVKLGPNKKR